MLNLRLTRQHVGRDTPGEAFRHRAASAWYISISCRRLSYAQHINFCESYSPILLCLTYTVSAVLFFVTLLLAAISQAWVSAYAVAWAVALAGPVLLVTIYLHELGHCLASKMVSLCAIIY